MAIGTGLHVLAPGPAPSEPVPVAVRHLPAGHRLGSGDLVTVRWPDGTTPDGVLRRPLGRVLATAVRRGEAVTDARVTGPGLLLRQPPGTVAVTVRLTDPAGTALLAAGRRIQLLGGPTDPAAIGATTGAESVPAGPPPAGSVPAGSVPGRSVPGAEVPGTVGESDPSRTRPPIGAGPAAEVLAADALVLAVSGQDVADGVGDGGAPSGPQGAGTDPGPLLGSGGTGWPGVAGSAVEGAGSGGVIVVAVDPATAARLAAAAGSRSISAAVPGPDSAGPS